jgi:hypothetical protein
LRACFFREMLRNKIPKVYFHFCFTERRSALFYHSESLFLFLFLGTEFGAFSLPQNGFGTEFREFTSIFSTVRNSEYFYLPGIGSGRNSESFLFCGTAGIPVGTSHLFRLFCLARNFFFVRKFPTPSFTKEFLGSNIIDLLNLYYSSA